MTSQTSEIALIEGLLPQLQAEGYEVFVNPRSPLVPAFLGSYHPDVIALRPDRNLAIEVAHRTELKEKKLRDVAALFRGRDDWEFRIIWMSAADHPRELPLQTRSEIAERLQEIDRLVNGAHYEAAFLLSWAVLEALARSALEKEFRRPQTPGRLLQVLAAEGLLSPDEADVLRPLVDLRNRLIHGELDVGISETDARAMAAVLKQLINLTKH
jgi:uncharacterized protein YutE (UPF0331/DUF86 family)